MAKVFPILIGNPEHYFGYHNLVKVLIKTFEETKGNSKGTHYLNGDGIKRALEKLKEDENYNTRMITNPYSVPDPFQPLGIKGQDSTYALFQLNRGNPQEGYRVDSIACLDDGGEVFGFYLDISNLIPEKWISQDYILRLRRLEEHRGRLLELVYEKYKPKLREPLLEITIPIFRFHPGKSRNGCTWLSDFLEFNFERTERKLSGIETKIREEIKQREGGLRMSEDLLKKIK